MKFVSLNMQYGFGQDGVLDLERTADMVRGADIIALQEVERFWRRTGMVDQPLEIASHLPDYYWVFGANLDMDAGFRDDDGRLWRNVPNRKWHADQMGETPGSREVVLIHKPTRLTQPLRRFLTEDLFFRPTR